MSAFYWVFFIPFGHRNAHVCPEPILLTQRCLAHTLPGYMKVNPKVSVLVEATDQTVNVIEERFDIAIGAKSEIEGVAGPVAKTLENSQRVLVVSPAFLDHYGRPENPADLPKFDTVASSDNIFDSGSALELDKPRRADCAYRVKAKAGIK